MAGAGVASWGDAVAGVGSGAGAGVGRTIETLRGRGGVGLGKARRRVSLAESLVRGVLLDDTGETIGVVSEATEGTAGSVTSLEACL